MNELSDEQWLNYLLKETDIPENLKNRIPIMPPDELQLQFTGAKGRTTLLMSLDFYKQAKFYITKHKIQVDTTKKLLDFGCGWGRITRMWLKELPNENVFGVDPLQDMIDLCQQTIPKANFYKIDPAPPLVIFENNMFDFLTAYSVFSHLNEEYSTLWIKEFSRIMRKNGLLFITTRSRLFIQYCADLREKAKYENYSNSLKSCFVDNESAIQKYDEEYVVHEPTGAGTILTDTFYGETCLPLKFFHQFNDFEVIDFIPELKYEPTQACVILKKK